MRKHHTIRTSGRVTARPSRRPAAEVLSGAALTGALLISLHAGGAAGTHLASGATAAHPGGGRITLVDAVSATGRVWVSSSSGQVTSPDGSPIYGQLAAPPARPVVAAAATPDGNGYWLAGSDGGVFAFGDAGFHGSTGGLRLNAPIVGMASTPDGRGYWLLGSDGGVFSFGDAQFHGSLGAVPPASPLRRMVADPAGGYWLVGASGDTYPFGPTGSRPSVAVASPAPPVTFAAAAGAAPPAAVPSAARVVAFAEAQIGKPYAWGGTGPGSYDCSGLTQASWGAAGVPLARVAAAQFNDGVPVPVGAAALGDLIFWSTNGTVAGIYHVGIALGNGRMLDAAKPGTTVRVEAIWPGAYPLATQP